jgi:hypothetical protein
MNVVPAAAAEGGRQASLTISCRSGGFELDVAAAGLRRGRVHAVAA